MHIPESIKIYGSIVIIVVAAFWGASQFIAPTPPKIITLAAGSAQGAYYDYAQRYKEALAKERITIKILETAGSLENITLLRDKKADIAFIQSGLATKENKEYIETLSSLYFEPLWVFTRSKNTKKKDLQNLSKSTIAIGSKGSGANGIARQLLKLNNVNQGATFVETSGQRSVDKLIKGEVDAAFFVTRAESANIQTLLHNKNINLLSFERAEGYAKLLPFLSKAMLYEGVVDMAKNIPSKDIHLISPVAQLTVTKDFNGALKTLLVSTAMQIHDETDLFSQRGQFPTLDYTDFPIADEAQRYFEYGPNLLQRILPFWLADMIGRMVIMLIPLLGVMLPLFKIAPPTYRWKTRSKIYKWYKSVKEIESAASTKKAAIASLKKIDQEVKKTRVPLSYTDELYNLRQHIEMIRSRLEKEENGG